jgi:hypothetical protein
MFGASGPGSFSTPPPPPGFGGGHPGAAFGGPLGSQAGAQQQQQRQVLVTGLPPGLSEQDMRMLFEVYGPLRVVTKVPEQVGVRVWRVSLLGGIRWGLHAA